MRRGVCYPIWTKCQTKNSAPTAKSINQTEDQTQTIIKNRTNWSIEKYVYTYSKYFDLPKKIKLNTDENNKTDNNGHNNDLAGFLNHVQYCSFRTTKSLSKDKIKVIPPF